MNRPQVFHGVTRVDHHVAVVRVQARVHERGLGRVICGRSVVGISGSRIHLWPIRVGASGRRQTVTRLTSARGASASDDVPSVALAAGIAAREAPRRQESARPLLRPVAVLLHMLGQIGFLCVTFPTKLKWEIFSMNPLLSE